MSIQDAEALADGCHWNEALAILNQMPGPDRSAARCLRVLLRCCCGLARWSEGEKIARQLRRGGDTDREIAAIFFYTLAVAHMQDGNKVEAQAAAEAAIETWEKSRRVIMQDRRLGELF